MMKVTSLLATVALVAAHTRDTFDAKEFTYKGRAPADAMMIFSAALPPRNGDTLDAILNDISNPKSPNYGNWLSQQEILDMTSPEPAIRTEVHNWLKAHGARCWDRPTSLRCQAKASHVEKMFNTEVSAFLHVPRDNREIYRVHPNALLHFPAELVDKLLFVTNIFDFPTKRMRLGSGIKAHDRNLRGVDVTPDYLVTLETLWNFYGTNSSTGTATSTQGPAEFQADSAIVAKDMKAFATNNGVSDWNITTKVGAFSGSDTEATLDEEYIANVGMGNTQWYWTEADWMYEWTEALKAAASLPAVFSVSWGWYEGDQCTIDPGQGPCTNPKGSYAYVAACNQGFAAATARGVSILVASGDSGAHGRTDPTCSSPITRPDWPAACPYILSIGGTQILNGVPIANPVTPVCKTQSAGGQCAGSGTEIVSSTANGSLIVSGGGFSNVAPQQSWQATAVSTYLKSGAKLPGSGNFNATSRGYPDVASLAHNVVIYESGPLVVDGTSCAAPVFGGVIGLANAARLKAGKKVLGFVNPAIYQIAVSTPSAFTDITIGDNSCTEDGCRARCTGYEAWQGWDATTGWGTPRVSNLVAALAALP
jgi:tripeptidyl-peptidase-1